MATKKQPRRAATEGDSAYEVLSNLDYDGELYKPGDEVTLDAAAAAELMALRVVKPVAAEKPAT
jgi:hypothetical protein